MTWCCSGLASQKPGIKVRWVCITSLYPLPRRQVPDGHEEHLLRNLFMYFMGHASREATCFSGIIAWKLLWSVRRLEALSPTLPALRTGYMPVAVMIRLGTGSTYTHLDTVWYLLQVGTYGRYSAQRIGD